MMTNAESAVDAYDTDSGSVPDESVLLEFSETSGLASDFFSAVLALSASAAPATELLFIYLAVASTAQQYVQGAAFC
jgi:hypothetical protein